MGDQVVEKVAWYLKYRTAIWGAVWCCVGFLGGNADRIKERIPTLQYTDVEVQTKLNEYEQLRERLEKIKVDIDKIDDGGV